MIKQTFCAVFATVLLTSASALAQGTPVQGTDTTKVKVVTTDAPATMQSEAELKANSEKDQQMMPAEEKTKIDRKGKKVKEKKTYR